jgi:hypothetical protein
LHGINAIAVADEDQKAVQKNLRETAITALIAGIKCMNPKSDADWVDPIMRNLAEDDSDRFGSIEQLRGVA